MGLKLSTVSSTPRRHLTNTYLINYKLKIGRSELDYKNGESKRKQPRVCCRTGEDSGMNRIDSGVTIFFEFPLGITQCCCVNMRVFSIKHMILFVQ